MNDVGYERLVLAVVDQAFRDYHKERSRKHPCKDEIDCIERWLDGADAKISFDLCCDVMGVDPKRFAERFRLVSSWRMYKAQINQRDSWDAALKRIAEGDIRVRERIKRQSLEDQIASMSGEGLAA